MSEIFNKHEMKTRRQELRREMTEAEELLWARIRNRQINGCKFRRQYSIGAYVVDFYSPENKIAIEIDGSSHDRADAIEYDKNRQEEIETLGIRVVRFTNKNVLSNLDMIIKQLSEAVTEQRQVKQNTFPLVEGKTQKGSTP
ncbi:MAG: endonuclease domain-containing protein [Bacteroidota bacterium]|jgi:very-short-patch-repair endonuclease